jgi:amino acid transporter
MRAATLVFQNLIRLLWIVTILFGIAFWLGHLLRFVPLHQALGLLIALCLIVLSILGIVGARAYGPGVAGIVIVILLPIVGMGQLSWLPGSGHVAIQVIHLLVGIAAIGIAEAVGARLRRTQRGVPRAA